MESVATGVLVISSPLPISAHFTPAMHIRCFTTYSGQRFAPAAKNIGDATKLRVPASYAMLFFGEEDELAKLIPSHPR
jgi:hypothetical protein